MFTVYWTDIALNQLTNVWLQSNDRQAVTDATERVDELLRRTPEEQGESRTGDQRIMVERPLGVLFRVDVGNQCVFVLNVWNCGPRRK